MSSSLKALFSSSKTRRDASPFIQSSSDIISFDGWLSIGLRFEHFTLGSAVEHVGGAKMNKEPKEPDGEPNEVPDRICLSEQGTPLSLKNIPVWPRVELPDETLKTIAQAQELSSGMAAAVKSIQMECKQIQDSIAATREVFNVTSIAFANLPDYASIFRSVYPALQRFADYAKEITQEINFGAIAGALRPIALKAKRIELLGKTNWPMYLVDDAEVCDALDMLSLQATDEELKELVAGIAYEYLDSEWLEETRSRWEDHAELISGERGILARALNRHEKGDYEGCVALLMNLLEGLVEKYFPSEMNKLEDEQAELFDLHAKKLGVGLSHKKNGEPRKLTNVKDKVLVMVVLSENGWYTFNYAAEYIVGITFANTMDADLASHNPLRNKICHGQQTEYGTLEHSLKAILVTDIVIRYGAAILESQTDVEC